MKATVRVIYKSGAQVDIKCDSFTVTRVDGAIEKVRWVNAKPTPLHVGVEEIAAVYEL